jgi:hypothetical protein
MGRDGEVEVQIERSGSIKVGREGSGNRSDDHFGGTLTFWPSHACVRTRTLAPQSWIPKVFFLLTYQAFEDALARRRATGLHFPDVVLRDLVEFQAS